MALIFKEDHSPRAAFLELDVPFVWPELYVASVSAGQLLNRQAEIHFPLLAREGETQGVEMRVCLAPDTRHAFRWHVVLPFASCMGPLLALRDTGTLYVADRRLPLLPGRHVLLQVPQIELASILQHYAYVHSGVITGGVAPIPGGPDGPPIQTSAATGGITWE
jgi:hypothetical protein